MGKSNENDRGFLEGKRLAIYKRVSTNEQDTEIRQNEIIGRYLEKHGIHLDDKNVKHFAEKSSAYSKGFENRSAFSELLNKMQRQEFDGVIVSDIDRLSRQTKEHFRLRKLFEEMGLPVIIASKGELYKQSETDELIKHLIEDGMTKLESDNNSTRTRDTFESLRSKGRFTGGKIPYGFKAIKETHKEYGENVFEQAEKSTRAKKDISKVIGIEVIPEEIKIVQCIYRSYQGGGTFSSIAKELNEARVSDGEPEKWSAKSVRYIISNPFYTGHFVYHRKSSSHGFTPLENWIWKPCPWFKEPPPISKEQWLACWQKYQNSKNENPYYLNTSFSFQGIIVCNCGNEMKGIDQRTKSKKDPLKKDGYRYYKCTCGHKVEADQLHQVFLDYYSSLPLPLKKVAEEVYERFAKEYEGIIKKIRKWELHLEQELSFETELLKVNTATGNEIETVFLEAAKDPKKIAFLISKKKVEESIACLRASITFEKRYAERLFELLKIKEIFIDLFHRSLAEMASQPHFLRTLVLCMVKECRYLGDNKVEISFYAMPPKNMIIKE